VQRRDSRLNLIGAGTPVAPDRSRDACGAWPCR
jgi:hypothetical protein